MGVVYEAFDRERGQVVALKSLLNFSPAALYCFKQEFRTLADVHHPNLVRLYELVVAKSDEVFFTMELVNGTDFLTHVQKPGTHHDAQAASLSKTPAGAVRSAPLKLVPGASVVPPQSVHKTSPADFDLLRGALRQLVEGVLALHGAGKLHRDIKPSNVMVADDGRVVILDFGVATEVSRVVDENLSEAQEIVGTVCYMAPEQAMSETATPASDWYSVGAVLYEALVGTTPFEGSAVDVLAMKTLHDPIPPSERLEGVPPDLDSLCSALLHRDAEKRPSGLEILGRLGPGRSIRPVPSMLPAADPAHATALVGRERQLATMRDVFEKALSGRSVTVRVTGASGMGKSAVAAHFLDGLVGRGEAVVLRGRAYERESVPYKAVDSVIDALSRYLCHLEEQGETIELPADIRALARVFPVLKRVTAIGAVAEAQVTDPNLVRGRAFSALRELLGTLAGRRPLVIYIDDAQWGDADSAALLLELVRPPQAPPVLFVMTQRDEDVQTSSFLKEMRERWPEGAEASEISVGPLDKDMAQQLALALLHSSDAMAQRTARAAARESRGSPFLIEELVRSNANLLGSEGATLATLTLEQMVAQRLERLTGDARLVVEVVAVGGRPISVSVIAQASGAGDGVEEAIAAARARRFLRTGLRDGHEIVEMSHDRFRETVVAQLSASRVREHHGRLARALEGAPGADAEAISRHMRGAGDDARAAHYAERAAEEAIAKLAFDQAARLLRLTLEILPASTPGLDRVQVRLGQVLEWAGRGADAAKVYLAAAETASTESAVELQRAAAEQLLSCGRVDEGTAVLRQVLPAVGLKGPKSPAAALLWLIVYRIWGAIVGARYTDRTADQIRPEDRVRIDALYAVAMGFSIVDVILGASMQARHLIAALRGGDRFRALRALSLETSHLASEGGPEGKRERALTRLATDLASRLETDAQGRAGVSHGDMHAQAFFQSNRGVSLFLRGRWKQAREALDVAYARTKDHHAGWQTNANLFGAYALHQLGEIVELRGRVARLLSEAERRADLYTSVNLHTTVSVVLALVADDADTARRTSQEAMAQWSQRGFLVQHMQTMVYQAEIELYAGNGASAFERVERDDKALRRSFLLKVQFIRGFALFARGRSAVAAAAAMPERRTALLAEARRIAARFERERMPWLSVHAAIIGAAAANVEGDLQRTVALLRAAIDGGDAANMPLHSAAARYRLGALLGGDEGRRLAREAQGALSDRGVRCDWRFVGMYLSGRWPENVGA
jgi:tetratricopeptide (TPR) repeat protein